MVNERKNSGDIKMNSKKKDSSSLLNPSLSNKKFEAR